MTPARLSGAEDARLQLAGGRPALVWRELVADTQTPVGAALKLIEPGRGDFLLESVEGGEVRGRFSLLGLDPDLVFRADGDGAAINSDWQTDRSAFVPCSAEPTCALRDLIGQSRIDVPDGLPPALACVVGYFSYETIGMVENVARAAQPGLGLPDMVFTRPTVLLVFDSLTDKLFCIAPVWPGEKAPDMQLEEAADRIDDTLRRLDDAAPRADGIVDLPEMKPEPAMPDGDYADMVARAKDYIVAGDIFQVVLSQRFLPVSLPPPRLPRPARVNPSPFLYLRPAGCSCGLQSRDSVRLRQGEVTIRPIAGTRPRGASRAEDDSNEKSLLADPKERAEHLMLLDLGRNDVGRVASEGSVEVTDSFTVERYSHVMHIVSNVVGKLDPSKDALDALFAGFPAGTVSGAPKIRACEIIAELERDARGPYAGGVGYFAPDGSFDSCIVLRTAVVKDDVMYVQAGAGIMADSDPAYEQRECEGGASSPQRGKRPCHSEPGLRPVRRSLVISSIALVLASCGDQSGREPVMRTEIGSGVAEDTASPNSEAEGAPAAQANSPCRRTTEMGVTYPQCIADPGRHRVTMSLGPKGSYYRTFARLAGARSSTASPVVFAVNGGMYDEAGAPIGYYVEDGERGASSTAPMAPAPSTCSPMACSTVRTPAGAFGRPTISTPACPTVPLRHAVGPML